MYPLHLVWRVGYIFKEQSSWNYHYYWHYLWISYRNWWGFSGDNFHKFSKDFVQYTQKCIYLNKNERNKEKFEKVIPIEIAILVGMK